LGGRYVLCHMSIPEVYYGVPKKNDGLAGIGCFW